MKRIIVLIDGTWNKEGVNADTNVAKLDPNNKKCLQRIIPLKAGETIQEVFTLCLKVPWILQQHSTRSIE
jgi:hypothetical protein